MFPKRFHTGGEFEKEIHNQTWNKMKTEIKNCIIQREVCSDRTRKNNFSTGGLTKSWKKRVIMNKTSVKRFILRRLGEKKKITLK
jgi:hypothetical protein